ncbi:MULTISPECIES: bifunctional [glutamine synthetase] adenylyltransferase/[glutamine synthetase]-adenylyl-L-tyrosine phosphorylase [Kordiimonas]|jgi:glutamate-ammonia-ligase adenylyltransferase|uniref:bifunctional [glutamine synthetase] adenylyltransferase/[glutamine synthetase]-adenylyl-L-tyrosine phosphorylase n=1 Tax=Kordiimonas TaxID=288021 RepID=UPI00257BB259|nr:bifunctional [glutamine synthetase] adenylyltransferase/[glutamine synthetase]-adenylyl-L-tyrosine phosphorylase [Kordiimonas sp. UBA4487]
MSHSTHTLPKAYHKEKADEIWAAVAESDSALKGNESARALADALFGHSNFLAGIARRQPALAAAYLQGDPDTHFEAILASLTAPRPDGEKTPDLMAFLREQKSATAFLTAAADVAGWWSLEDVTTALSRFADAALELALAHLLHASMKAGELAWPNGEEEAVSPALAASCGYFILGMGKLGAYELNYSSDIDLIALYDTDRVRYTGTKTVKQCFIRLTQELMKIMETRTMHGYVFRTDLRLRPDPGATPVALAVEAAETYYHSMAVNWERSAMIKARVVAGDQTAGKAYLETMARWIWRKNMDFAALNDIAAIKNQINRHYGQTQTAFKGYNVKLGYGGIREIEFFTQINQLLHAGRHPALRLRGTLDALDMLAMDQIIDGKIHKTLSKGYRFLRTLEHRIQMMNDEQTHDIPDDDDRFACLVSFMGYADEASFKEAVTCHTKPISQIYEDLLPEDDTAKNDGYSEGDLPATLAKLGFEDPDNSAAVIDGWRRGRHRALRTERARGLLEQILPGLLEAFSGTENAGSALTRFDRFISQLPGGVQLFSLLQSNPSLFQLLAHVMGLAPALAETLGKKPDLWDAVLEPGFYAPLESEEDLREKLEELLDSARDYQDILDIVRRFVAEHRFRIGVQLLESLASVEECGEAHTRLADVTLKALTKRVEDEFATKHGRFEGGGISIVAMGKYGGGELTHTSDLDIVFLYHVPDMDSLSDGPKPLMPSQYFSRLGQHIITAITALTPEGRLYEVDTRLRPSGSQGPLVVTLKTFADYYTEAAWAWEHMALTRARVILAPDSIREPLISTIISVLTASRDGDALLRAVHDMRGKLFAQFGTDNPWAIKHARGGLVDMEFICQYLMLREGNRAKDIFHPQLDESISRLAAAGALTEEQAATLHGGHEYMQQVQSLLRLCLGGSPAYDSAIPKALRSTLCRATGKATFNDLRADLVRKQSDIYSLFQTVIEEPANALPTAEDA